MAGPRLESLGYAAEAKASSSLVYRRGGSGLPIEWARGLELM